MILTCSIVYVWFPSQLNDNNAIEFINGLCLIHPNDHVSFLS